MTDEPTAPVRIPRAAAGRSATGRRQHTAAATRLVVGGAALAGTFGMAAAMAAEPAPAFVAAPAASPTIPAPTTTVPTPAPAPRTIVVVRRHVVTGNGSTVVRQSTTPAVRSTPTVRSTPAPTPAPQAAPAPAPNTTTKGS